MATNRQSGRPNTRRRMGIMSLAASMILAVLVAIPLLAQAKDPINYTIVFGHTDGTTTTISGVGNDNNVFIADAGGTDKDNPTGMIMHLSCSDEFPDGWGEKEGPDPILDSEWQVVSYYILKGHKTCGTPTPPAQPSIDLEKATNGEDADNPTGPEIEVGGDVEWTFVITNTGDINLFGITLVDKETIPNAGSAAAISCPRDSLAPGESMTCTAYGSAIEGQYGNLAKVTGTALVSTGANTPPPGVSGEGKYAVFTFVDPATGDRTTLTIEITDKTQYIPDAGGTSQDDPTGMTMHLSCSDEFSDGWGEKDDPDATLDSAWKVEAFWIFEIKKDNELKTKCGEPIPIEKTVMDTDPSHYIGVPGAPAVDIEKHTNGEDADSPKGPTFSVGAGVHWEYIVTNMGDVDLVNLTITDDQEGNGTVPFPPWNWTGVIGTIDFLAPGDSVTLTWPGTAVEGQYANWGCVVGYSRTDVEVTDCDPSHYFAEVPGEPGVDIEKHTNGHDADLPPGPTLQAGDTVTWEYIVTNTGSVDLYDLVVDDDKEGYIGTIPFLAPGDSETLVHLGIAVPGQYENEGCVVGKTEQGEEVEDCDPSHYDPPVYEEPAIDIEKATNGHDADDPTGPRIPVGDTVEWTYVITNTGDEPLWGIYVYDEREGRVDCPERYLAVGDSMTCTMYGTARAGQYANEAWVTGWGSSQMVADNDWSHYFGGADYESGARIDIEKATNGLDADSQPGPQITVGDTVSWTYVITNTGDEPLWGIYVYDETEGHIACPARYLAVGDSMTCTEAGEAAEGQYANEAWVTAWGYDSEVGDVDWSHYFGLLYR